MTVALEADRVTGHVFSTCTVTVDRSRLAFFAEAIGEDDPVYRDVAAARAAGHPDVPIPPTFYFSAELDAYGLDYLADVGIDLRRVLHAEQSFEYHAMAHAGEALTLRPKFVNTYAKKGGALDFVVRVTEIRRDGEPVATTRQLIVVRNEGQAA